MYKHLGAALRQRYPREKCFRVVEARKDFLFMFDERAAAPAALDSKPELEGALALFDKDGSGFIDAEGLRHITKSLGENLEESELEEMIKEADLDKDGKINFDEFLKIMAFTR